MDWAQRSRILGRKSLPASAAVREASVGRFPYQLWQGRSGPPFPDRSESHIQVQEPGEIREKMFGGKMSGAQLERLLNETPRTAGN